MLTMRVPVPIIGCKRFVNVKHQKPRKQGEEGGIIKVSTPIYVSKLALYCPKCKKGVRVKSVLDGDTKVRACTKCGTVI